MEVTLSVATVVIILILLNTIVDHLFNWWFRDAYNSNDVDLGRVLLIVYLVKMSLLLFTLITLLN